MKMDLTQLLQWLFFFFFNYDVFEPEPFLCLLLQSLGLSPVLPTFFFSIILPNHPVRGARFSLQVADLSAERVGCWLIKTHKLIHLFSKHLLCTSLGVRLPTIWKNLTSSFEQTERKPRLPYWKIPNWKNSRRIKLIYSSQVVNESQATAETQRSLETYFNDINKSAW